MDRADLLRFARLGAEARAHALRQELDAIYRQFPELQTGRSARADSAGSLAGAPSRPRRRRRMSREARKRIGEAQRKRWAELKEKQAAGPAAGTKESAPKSTAAASRKKR